MKTYARIENGLVVEMIAEMLDGEGVEIPIADRFHPNIAATIVDASAAPGVAQGWTYAGGAFSAPVAPVIPLADVKSAKLAQLSSECSMRMDAIKAGYPAEEVQSWDKQESEARAYTVSSSAATPLLSALAAARGITLADLAARVIAKADQFAAASGAIIGKRQHYEDQVTAATDAATVEAIVWQD
jgi:hypothetical protein